ncbi:hypothetical protein [Armatimonas sp.]|uniref:hypothetical protein n=1 Tax=Armatimonas sp. TaxID=1872638 RepID=UPI00286AC9DD|nr:hypothetical protein [Armatimonas sp.]
MSSKDTLSETGAALTRAGGTLSVLSGVAPELLAAAQVELDAYKDAAATLETKAKALEEHLNAIVTLLPEVRKETRALKQRNKKAYTLLQKVLHGKSITARPAPKAKPIPPAPTESVVREVPAVVATPAPKKPTATRRKTPTKTS